MILRIPISLGLFSLLVLVLWISTQHSHALYFGNTIGVTKAEHLKPLVPNQMAVTQNGNWYIVYNDNKSIYLNSGLYNKDSFRTIVLSDKTNSASFPQLTATENGNVYVVWIEKNNTTGDSNIVFRSSNNRGENFSSKKELSGINSLSFYPQISATEKGNVYVVWIEKNNTTGDSNIVFRSSNNRGENFSSKKELSGINSLSFYPQISATEKGNVYVVWVDINSKNGDSNILFRSSNDEGKNFAQEVLLRGGKDLSLFPRIATTEKGNVYVVWVDINSKNGDSNILFRTSNDSGENFGDRKFLRGGKLLSTSPQVAATEEGGVNTIWIDHNRTTGSNDLVLRKSTNYGQDFDSRVYPNRDGDELSKSFSPQIAATENGNVYAVWIDGNLKFKQIFDTEGQSGETVSIGNNTFTTQIAATDNGNVYVIWTAGNSTNTDGSLYFKRISEYFFDRNS